MQKWEAKGHGIWTGLCSQHGLENGAFLPIVDHLYRSPFDIKNIHLVRRSGRKTDLKILEVSPSRIR